MVEKFCANCGVASKISANYCIYCGAKLEKKVGLPSGGILDYETYIIEKNHILGTLL
jgi:uncharacterized OB-fold protein